MGRGDKTASPALGIVLRNVFRINQGTESWQPKKMLERQTLAGMGGRGHLGVMSG